MCEPQDFKVTRLWTNAVTAPSSRTFTNQLAHSLPQQQGNLENLPSMMLALPGLRRIVLCHVQPAQKPSLALAHGSSGRHSRCAVT